MAVAKVILNGTTLIDVTQKTVTSATMLDGYTALKNDGTDITGSYVPSSAVLQTKTVSPSISSATYTPDVGYDGFSEFTVNAMPIGSATTPATTIQPTPSISVSSSGLINVAVQDYEDITPTVVSGYVSSGTSGRVEVDGYDTYQLPTQAAVTITPSTVQQTAVAQGKFTTGAVIVDPIPSQYIIPTGTINIVSNGTVDVTQYASASVSVPSLTPPTNMITNGEWSGSGATTTGWSSINTQASVSIISGKLVLTHNTTSNRAYGVYYSVNTQAGHTYAIAYKLTKTMVDTDADARGIIIGFGSTSGQEITRITSVTQGTTLENVTAATASSNDTQIRFTFLGSIATAASSDSMLEFEYVRMYDITDII